MSAALVASDQLFGRESDSGSKGVGSLEERTALTWIRGVVDSLEEGQTAVPFDKPKEADTLRPSSMLNIDL